MKTLNKREKVALAVLGTGIAGGILAVVLFPQIRKRFFGSKIVVEKPTVTSKGATHWEYDCPPPLITHQYDDGTYACITESDYERIVREQLGLS